MSFLNKLFGGRKVEEIDDAPITLDVERRRPQLIRLEEALDALAHAMREQQTMANPGWRARVNEYSRLAGETAEQKRTPSREGLLDIIFSIRPVFTGVIPEGMEALAALQDEVLAAANDLRELLPGERA